ncbi:MAG: transglycosylase family protein [Acidimicrobiales bacterium]
MSAPRHARPPTLRHRVISYLSLPLFLAALAVAFFFVGSTGRHSLSAAPVASVAPNARAASRPDLDVPPPSGGGNDIPTPLNEARQVRAQLAAYVSGVEAQEARAAAAAQAAAQAAAAQAQAAAVAPDTVTPAQRAAWDKVNMCEEDGVWDVNGPNFSGGLGFSHANWDRFNTFGFPADAADATPDQQIQVAVAFATAYYGSPDVAPDQDGCTGGY